MGGEQAANVLLTVKQEQLKSKNLATLTTEQAEEFKKPTLDKYQEEGSCYYSSARLWDDGVIAPTDTRKVLGLGLAAAQNAPLAPHFQGVFRM